jgi:hypothetical protein
MSNNNKQESTLPAEARSLLNAILVLIEAHPEISQHPEYDAVSFGYHKTAAALECAPVSAERMAIPETPEYHELPYHADGRFVISANLMCLCECHPEDAPRIAAAMNELSKVTEVPPSITSE